MLYRLILVNGGCEEQTVCAVRATAIFSTAVLLRAGSPPAPVLQWNVTHTTCLKEGARHVLKPHRYNVPRTPDEFDLLLWVFDRVLKPRRRACPETPRVEPALRTQGRACPEPPAWKSIEILNFPGVLHIGITDLVIVNQLRNNLAASEIGLSCTLQRPLVVLRTQPSIFKDRRRQ